MINKKNKTKNEKLIVFDKLIFLNKSLVHKTWGEKRKMYEKSSLIIPSKLLQNIDTNNKYKNSDWTMNI